MTEEMNVTKRTNDTTSQNANDKYRRAFLLTLVSLILVIAFAVWMCWESSCNAMGGAQKTATKTGNDLSESPAQAQITSDCAVLSSDTPLSPIQLSPHRKKRIGVKIG